MKFSKVLFAVAFSFLISSFAFANVDTPIDPNTSSKTVTTKIKTIIQNLNIDLTSLQSKTVKLKFLINESDELVVLSTGDSELDNTLKSALNYTHVDVSAMKYNKVYILPVTFK